MGIYKLNSLSLRSAFIAMAFCIPIFSNMGTLIGLLISIWAIFTGKWRGSAPSEIRKIAILSGAVFGVLVLSNLINSPLRELPSEVAVMMQFAYLPFAFFALFTANIFDTNSIQKYLYLVIIIMVVFASIEHFFVNEDWIYAPFGLEGNRRYWYVGILDEPRIALLTGNPLTLTDLNLPIVFLLWFRFWKKSFREKCLVVGLFFCASFALIFWTQNRSALVGFLALFIITFFYSLATSSINRKIFVGIGAGALGLLCMGMLVLGVKDSPLGARFGQMSAVFVEVLDGKPISQIKDVSLGIRLDYYRSAMEAIQLKPVLGYGASDQIEAVKPYFQTKQAREATHLKTLHSLYFNNLVAGGVVLLLLILCLVLSPVILVLSKPNSTSKMDWLYAAMIISGSILVLGLTNNIFYDDAKNTGFLTYIFMFFIIYLKEQSHQTLTD